MYSYKQKGYSCQTDENLELYGCVTQDYEIKQNGLKNSDVLGLDMSHTEDVSHSYLPVSES